MTCHRIVQNGVFVGYACTRGRGAKAHACACGRTATRLCDGRVRTPTNRTRRCDRPLCDTHATSVGEDRDLCPDCRAAEAPAPAPAGALDAWVRAFFGGDFGKVWSESPKSRAGQEVGVWHWRLFCDAHWRPILPRKEVYSKDFTELGWKSASEVLVPDGRGLTA